MNETPLSGFAAYNPHLLSREELKRSFVARLDLLAGIIDDLRREDAGRVPQHRLILGTRGMGKTTLLRRLAAAVEEDPELSALWLPLVFPEEQYNIAKLSDFWRNCLDALGDLLEARGEVAGANQLDREVEGLGQLPEKDRASRALEVLLSSAKGQQKRLLLLVDNVDIVFERLADEHWAVRAVLQHEPSLLIVGASARAIEATYQYDSAFYDLFKIEELKSLSVEEMVEILRNLARQAGNDRVLGLIESEPARIKALHTLTGGNPRTAVLLYGVLGQGIDGGVRSDLERLLDQCTPLYKARFEEFPPQAQRILDALALQWDPITANQLSARLDLSVNAVSSQLTRLEQQGVVEKVPYPGKRAAFQIAERFFNIWYLMRASRRIRRRLLWLAEFLRAFYSQEELLTHARRYLTLPTGARLRLTHAENAFAFAHAVEAPSLRAALENVALHALIDERCWRTEFHSLVDLRGEDAPLRPRAERIEALAALRERVLEAPEPTDDEAKKRLAFLLCGSPDLSLSEKEEEGRKSEKRTAEDAQALLVRMEERFQWWSGAAGGDATPLYCALGDGDMGALGDREGAEAAAERLEAPVLTTLALAEAVRKGAHDVSIARQIRSALRQHPCAFAWDALANHHIQVEEWQAAKRYALKAVEENPRFPCAWMTLVQTFVKQGRFSEAVEPLKKVIKLCPTTSCSTKAAEWAWLAMTLHLSDQSEEAIDAARKALQFDESMSNVWGTLGSALSNLGRFEEALEPLQRAVSLDPMNAARWAVLGMVLARLGRFDDAVNPFRKAAELEPSRATPWDGLAVILDALGRREEAAECLRRSLALAPSKAKMWLSLAQSLAQSGNPEEAKAEMARAADMWATEPGPRLGTVYVLAALGEWENAAAALKRSFGGPEGEGEVRLGWDATLLLFQLLLDLGKRAELLKLLEDSGLNERWEPLALALRAVTEGNDALLTAAPEVRAPAERILAILTEEAKDRE